MLDILIIFGFIVYSIANGFRNKSKASQNLQEYFLAGRGISGWRAGFSMAATQFAADTPLLVTGLIATGGIFMVWRLWIYGIAFLMMGFIFAANWRRAGVLTDAELTEVRYSGKGVLFLRVLKAVYYGTVINCVVMAMVLVAAMRIAEVFLPWHEWLPAGIYNFFLGITHGLGLSLGESVTGLDPALITTNNLISILVIVSFTALYSTTGGLRSVIATDVMQFSLAMIGTLVYAAIVIYQVGGLGGLTDRLVELYGIARTSDMLSFVPTGPELVLPFLVIIGLQWLFQMYSDGTGYLAQRTMSCTTDREARLAALIFTWLQILLRSLFWLIIGVGLLVIYPFDSSAGGGELFAASREITFVHGVNDLLPPGIRGLMLTGLLAALASTVDTHLNWGASYWSNDIYQRLICHRWLNRKPKNRELVLVARLSNLFILIIALTIMANLGSIQTAWFISLLFGAGMGSVLVLRWLWERINLFSELAAMATSLIVAPILLVATDQEWLRLAGMAGASTFVTILVTYLTPPTNEEILKLSLFLLLIGIGKFMIPSPGQWAWLPALYTFAGLALVPLWWGKALESEKIVAEDLQEEQVKTTVSGG
ncbi:MAG: Na+:solute symporter [Calditrichia bacterium]